MKENTLDDLLTDWHQWARGWTAVAAYGSCAMFAGVRSSSQWDSEREVVDGALDNIQMRSFDFHVNELSPMHRTALQIEARNLATGSSVWTSARLPENLHERRMVLQQAKSALINRLIGAGIL